MYLYLICLLWRVLSAQSEALCTFTTQEVRDAALAERVKLQNTPPLQLQLQAWLTSCYGSIFTDSYMLGIVACKLLRLIPWFLSFGTFYSVSSCFGLTFDGHACRLLSRESKNIALRQSSLLLCPDCSRQYLMHASFIKVYMSSFRPFSDMHRLSKRWQLLSGRQPPPP